MKNFIRKAIDFKDNYPFTYIIMCLLSPMLAAIITIPLFYLTGSIDLYCTLEVVIPVGFFYNFLT